MLANSASAAALVVVFTTLSLTASVGAGINEWTSQGPFGGTVSALALDSADPTTVYAATANAGVFKSRDRGVHWTALSGGQAHQDIRALVLDSHHPSTLFLASEAGVFKSSDGGVHWTVLGGNLTRFDVQALAIHPSTPSIMFAGTSAAGVLKSSDGGTSWEPLTVSEFQSSDVFSETALFVTARVSRNSLLRPWPSARSAYLTVSEFQSSEVFFETALFVTAGASLNSLLRPGAVGT